MLVCSDNKKAYNALYSYFDIFVEMMNNQDNFYIRTRGLRLIAYNSKWDIHNQVNSIIEK